uniref:Uncharacterized protein n=1 Tax=Anguilla anguilla TaxID=7936 RepID=A0A0E9UWC5_ANGAN
MDLPANLDSGKPRGPASIYQLLEGLGAAKYKGHSLGTELSSRCRTPPTFRGNGELPHSLPNGDF